jgi:hypothetical protein
MLDDELMNLCHVRTVAADRRWRNVESVGVNY